MKENREDRQQELEALKREYLDVSAPEEGKQNMLESIRRARREKEEAERAGKESRNAEETESRKKRSTLYNRKKNRK